MLQEMEGRFVLESGTVLGGPMSSQMLADMARQLNAGGINVVYNQNAGTGQSGSTSTGGATAAAGAPDPDDDEKPKRITNPKHHPNSQSPEPKNVDELFENSIVDDKGVRWAKDSDGAIHRFSPPRNGETHWNGSTAGKDPISQQTIPNYIKKALGYKW